MFEWKEITLEDGKSLCVDNGNAPLSEGIHVLTDFIGTQVEERIIGEISEGSFVWEGFDQRRRVQRFDLDNNELKCADDNTLFHSLLHLREQLQDATAFRYSHASIEEYGSESWSENSSQVVTTFESTCSQIDCPTCSVALVPLRHDAMAHWNRPLKRQAMCWTLHSPDHQTNVLLKRGHAYIRSGEHLHLWRSRLGGDTSETSTLVVKFYHLQKSRDSVHIEEDCFGYIPRPITPAGSMPPLEDILTIIVTTSPIRSNPSTELLEKVFETFQFAGDSFCYKCRKVIVCDGSRTSDDSSGNVSKKHQNIKQAMRSGIVTGEQAKNYQQFKDKLKSLCAYATADSPFYNSAVEELNERFGFGYALRHVVQHCVDTKFVCVIQHDRTFMRPTPINETLQAMWNHPNIKYAGCSMRSNLTYRDIFFSKYGKAYTEEYERMTLRLPELLVDASLYGPDSNSCKEGLEANPKLRENLLSLAEHYRGTSQCVDQHSWVQRNLDKQEQHQHQITLSPTVFWYDNIHLVETEHYRNFVFNPLYKMVARGGFVEEGVLPVLKKTLDRLGLKEGHARFGCYLIDDHSGFFFTGHLDGGSYLPEAERNRQ